jgi:hypothetical protein
MYFIGRSSSQLIMAELHCVGCDEPLIKPSREHILPEWLAKEVFIPNVELKLFRRNDDNQEDELLREHGLNNFVVKNVCETCNNGWMSRLETRAKPFILELMNESKTLRGFASDGNLAVSRWAAKTAFMIASAQPAQVDLLWTLFMNMRVKESAGPEGCYVFVGQVFSLNQGFTYACLRDQKAVDENAIVQLRVGFSLKRLHLIVVIPLVDGERVFTIDQRMHRPLWPPNVAMIHRPANPPIQFETLAQAQFFLTNLIEAGLFKNPFSQ